MKYEIKGKQIFVFERRKTIDNRFIWFPVSVFTSYADLQNSNFQVTHASLEALKVFKKLFI